MKAQTLNPIDASWLFMESRSTPMHVAGMMIFELPDHAAPDYFQQLFADTRQRNQFQSPWNRRLRSSRLKNPKHAWVEEQNIDLDYHVRLSALPWPGGERELGKLIERLHSHPLDMRRPPWECHVIQGLEGNRFALYIKMHHALIDGVSAMRLFSNMLAKTPDDNELPAFWAVPPARRHRPASTLTEQATGNRLDGLRQTLSAMADLTRATGGLIRATFDKKNPMGAPFKAPASVLNGRISGQRRFATQNYSLDRIKALAKAADCTLNDIVLALSGAALRRFLLECNALPAQSLTAGIPVSVQPKDNQETGNAVSFIIASLGTDIADPLARLAAISASTRCGKTHLQRLPKEVIEPYTMLMMGPYIIQMMSGLAGRTRPVFNLTISNVQGSQESLYLRGAKMVANYPVSLVAHGQALNITCLGYAGTLNFGFLGCRGTLPHMQRIAVYTGEALEELEAAIAQRG